MRAFLADASDIHLPRTDKLQSPGDRVEQIATIDVPLQNGGTKTQEENPDPGKFVSFFTLTNYLSSLNKRKKKLEKRGQGILGRYKRIHVLIRKHLSLSKI